MGLVDGLVCMGRGGVGGFGGGGLVFVFGMMAGGAWCGVGGVCVGVRWWAVELLAGMEVNGCWCWGLMCGC